MPGDSVRSVVIVGASLAGARTAESLRARGFDGRIVLVGREPYLPYERPPLSKAFLAGTAELESVYLRASADWEPLDLEFVLGEEVTSLVPTEASVELRSGRRIEADRVVLCTGGGSRRTGISGEDAQGVYHLRTLDDAIALGAVLRGQPIVAIVGGGFIGAEVAASAVQLGCAVTILELAPSLMLRGLGGVWGPYMTEKHRRRGVSVRTGVRVSRLVGEPQVRGVELATGELVDADVVLIAVGMAPAVELAADAGIAVDNGIVVDESGRTTHRNVFAAGDVTSAPRWRGGGRCRYESVRHAEEQAAAVAAAMLGQPAPVRDVPWFWSDQYEDNIQFAGSLLDDDDILIREESDSSFVAFHVRGQELHGVLGINRGRDVRAAMRLIAARTPIDRDALTDSSVDLRKLAVAARG
jgi:3-phenylpropionate/trans-cinnamate dioxygenase ferredoxin reductase subunit